MIILRATIIILILSFSSSIYGYYPVVSEILGEFEDTIDDVVDQALDRFDLSVVNTGIELQRSLNVLRINYEDILGKTLEELDGTQRKAIQDLMLLIDGLEDLENAQIKDAIEKAEDVVATFYNLLSDDAIIHRFKQDLTQEGENFITIKVEGRALSIDQITQIGFIDEFKEKEKFEDILTEATESKLVFKLPLPTLKDEKYERFIDRGMWNLPFSIKMKSCFIWNFGCKESYQKTNVAIFPRTIGTIEAVFTGEVTNNSRQSKSIKYLSTKVKSRIKWTGIKKGYNKTTFTLQPDSGWKILPNTAKVSIKKLMKSGCNKDVETRISKKTNHILQTITKTVSDKKAGATCRTETTMAFVQIKPDKKTTNIKVGGEDKTIKIQGDEVLQLPSKTKLQKPRLSHIVITSPLIRESQNNQMVISHGKNNEFGYGKIKVNYKPANNSVHVSLIE